MSVKAAEITVVIPVWDDYAELLPACVESVLRQSEPVRVTVVDNASARPLPPLPEGVELVRLERRLPIGRARDAVLQRIATPYVLYLDADDELLPGSLEFLRSRLERRPHAVATIGRFLSFNPRTGEELLLARLPKPIVYPVSRLRRLFALLNLRYNTFLAVGCLYRRSALVDVGGFGPDSIGEDWVLGALLCFRGRIDFTRQLIWRRRIHLGSLWHRSHTSAELAAPRRALRDRARSDQAVPRWVKALLPLLARLHDRDVARAAPDGSFAPSSTLLGDDDGAARRSSRLLGSAALVAGLAIAFALRWQGRHQGLIYPDGYQYLLMAKGIAIHLTPMLRLGHGGELFAPSIDAALKPLFPALVALLSPLVSIRSAADLLAAAAAATTVVLAGLVATRMTRSRVAGVAAAAAALLSPALVYWSGFTGPDQLAQALALAAGFALACGRARTAGVLGGLCAATRPEWLLVLAGAGAAGLMFRCTRERSARALLAGVFTLAAVIGLLRPPLGVPPGGFGALAVGFAASVALQVIAARAAQRPLDAVVAAGAGIGAVAVVAASGSYPALTELLRHEWPLLVLAGAGILIAAWRGPRRGALMLLASVLLLGATYAYRNSGSERYVSEMLPLAAVACGLAVLAPVPTPLRALAPGLAVTLTLLLAPPPPAPASDTFATLAGPLSHAPPGTLVSAAPDAYGFLLPARAQRQMVPGARGLVLLDAAQRTYAPELGARGTVVARLTAPNGFERPDGTIDTGPALLVRGVVTLRR